MLYVAVIMPALKGADYTVAKILYEVFPTEVQAIFPTYRDSFAAGLSKVNLSSCRISAQPVTARDATPAAAATAAGAATADRRQSRRLDGPAARARAAVLYGRLRTRCWRPHRSAAACRAPHRFRQLEDPVVEPQAQRTEQIDLHPAADVRAEAVVLSSQRSNSFAVTACARRFRRSARAAARAASAQHVAHARRERRRARSPVDALQAFSPSESLAGVCPLELETRRSSGRSPTASPVVVRKLRVRLGRTRRRRARGRPAADESRVEIGARRVTSPATITSAASAARTDVVES